MMGAGGMEVVEGEGGGAGAVTWRSESASAASPPPLQGSGSMWSGAEGCVGGGQTLELM